MSWVRAIVRIQVGASRGTGCLVSTDGLVLTAFHVLGDREQSLREKRPCWYGGAISCTFTKLAGTPTATAQVEGTRFDPESDVALLRLSTVPAGAVTLELARLPEPREGVAFDTLGFPAIEPTAGGDYGGTFGPWLDDTELVEARADFPVGSKMGGISGAPAVVNGQVVGMVLQTLADERNQTVKASLFVAPIERVIRQCGAEGLVWDEGDPIDFEDEIEPKLPNDEAILVKTRTALGLTVERAKSRLKVTRRLLQRDLVTARTVLKLCGTKAPDAHDVLAAVAAMGLPAASVLRVRAAVAQPKPALIASCRVEIHHFYTRRVTPMIGPKKVVTVHVPAAERDAAIDPVDDILARARAQLAAQVKPGVVQRMLAPTAEDPLWWLVLFEENRFDIAAAVARRLPSAHVLVTLPTLADAPAIDDDLVVEAGPALSPAEQDRLADDLDLYCADF